MSSPITLFIKSSILPGKAQALKEVLQQVIVHCQSTEPDMLRYDWYINATETECCVLETYASSEAVLFHFSNYAQFRPLMAECRQFREINVLGNPSEELQAALGRLDPAHYSDFIGLEQ